jgi:hypothetical protein
LPSKYPTDRKSRHLLAASHDPYCSYHNNLALSRDRHVGAPAAAEFVAGQFRRIGLPQAVKQHIPQPLRVTA